MCDLSHGSTLIRYVQRYITKKEKTTYQIYYTFYTRGYSLIFKDEFRRAYIFNKDGSFNEIINLVEHVASDGSLHRYNNLVDYFRKTKFNIDKYPAQGSMLNYDISMKTRDRILEFCGVTKEMEEYTDIMSKYDGSQLWPSIYSKKRILEIESYLKSVKEKLDTKGSIDLIEELYTLITPDPEESYWNEIDVVIDYNLMVILFRLYTLSIQDQNQEYDYILYQISNILIAGNPDINIKDVYFRLQDERLTNYHLKIIDVDDKILLKIINMFYNELKKVSNEIHYLSRYPSF